MKSYEIPLESDPQNWWHKRRLKMGGTKRLLLKESQWFIENKVADYVPLLVLTLIA
jgi:hypothetical protein